jgi:hypothetical protein
MSPLEAAEAPRLHVLDEARRAQHCFLESGDLCRYLWDYTPGPPRTQQQRLIGNLKCRPTQVALSALRGIYKERAILRAAHALRAAAPRRWVEETSWSPIPPSARLGDADYDDRLLRILDAAFDGYDADIRPLVRQVRTVSADHRNAERLSFTALYALTEVDRTQLLRRPLRAHVVLFDDVLTTGKHFKCAQARLQEALGNIPISTCVLARRALTPGRRGLTGGSADVMANDARATPVGRG